MLLCNAQLKLDILRNNFKSFFKFEFKRCLRRSFEVKFVLRVESVCSHGTYFIDFILF